MTRNRIRNIGTTETWRPAPSVISLNGTWWVATDPGNTGRTEEWYRTAKPPEARETAVPSIIQAVFPGYHGVAWYGRAFCAPRHPLKGGRCLLRFWAVGYYAEVWVNGVPVGSHEGGESPFTLDATDAIRPGENQVRVRVLNPTHEPIDGMPLAQTPHRNKSYPPRVGNDLNHGGIFLPVELILAPAVRIHDLYARPDWKTGIIRLCIGTRNTTTRRRRGRLDVRIAPATTGETLGRAAQTIPLPGGDSSTEMAVQVPDHRLWSLEEPYLYRVSATLTVEGLEGEDETTTRCGFRDFRVEGGFFRLNGRRIIMKSTHTGNGCPVGQIIPPDAAPDLLRRDLLYAKACGYNMVRFIAMAGHPWQLDMCDEIGLLVYEETYAAWLLEDSSDMGRRFDFSVRETVLRDRNHPSLAILGLLNETFDGPVFRHAVGMLPLVRSLDEPLLVLLSSGRWDGQWSIGSVSNPGSKTWEHVWGSEGPDASAVSAKWDATRGGYLERAGDAHIYPIVPHPAESVRLLRTIGAGEKPVLLSEYGIGSMMNVVHETRSYEQHGCRRDLEDYGILRAMAERLASDMDRWGMRDVYAYPEELLIESQRRMARHRTYGFDIIRSNPNICGYNLTGMLDHGLTGEGMWGFWRTWKPGAMDALQNGWWPLRWCLFVDPPHAYSGRTVTLEAVMANEDVLPPGSYPVRFSVIGPEGIAWEKATRLVIPAPAPGEETPLAVGVLKEEVTLRGAPGAYRLVADTESGGAPLNRSVEFTVSDTRSSTDAAVALTLWGVDEPAARWLGGRGFTCARLESGAHGAREIILVGDPSGRTADPAAWIDLAGRIVRGGVCVFLSCQAFQRSADARENELDVGFLPLVKKGRCHAFNDWLYHKECVARRHPIFDGLQGNGIMDWYYYGPLIPRHVFEDQDDAGGVIAASFATGYCGGGSAGYESGILMSEHRLGAGRFLLNTFPILQNLDVHPAADRFLLNLISYASRLCAGPLAGLPTDFQETLQSIGYS